MGKKVNFTRDAINKHFETIEDLDDFIDEYSNQCSEDMEFLDRMHEYMSSDNNSSLSCKQIGEFIDNQKKELEEFLKSHDDISTDELEDFLMLQDKDAKDFIEGKYNNNNDEEDDEDEEEDDDFREEIKDIVREVFYEEAEKAANKMESIRDILGKIIKEDK